MKGVGYLTDKNLGNCSAFPLGSQFDVVSLGLGLGLGLGASKGIELKTPAEFFYLDESYYFTGQVILV